MYLPPGSSYLENYPLKSWGNDNWILDFIWKHKKLLIVIKCLIDPLCLVPVAKEYHCYREKSKFYEVIDNKNITHFNQRGAFRS